MVTDHVRQRQQVLDELVPDLDELGLQALREFVPRASFKPLESIIIPEGIGTEEVARKVVETASKAGWIVPLLEAISAKYNQDPRWETHVGRLRAIVGPAIVGPAASPPLSAAPRELRLTAVNEVQRMWRIEGTPDGGEFKVPQVRLAIRTASLLQRMLDANDLSETDLQVLGEHLFAIMFGFSADDAPGERSKDRTKALQALRTEWAAATADAPLRVVFQFGDPCKPWALLSWEHMYIPEYAVPAGQDTDAPWPDLGGAFLRSESVAVIRHPGARRPIIPRSPPLTLLMLGNVNAEHQPEPMRGPRLEDPTLDAIKQWFATNAAPHVIHVVARAGAAGGLPALDIGPAAGPIDVVKLAGVIAPSAEQQRKRKCVGLVVLEESPGGSRESYASLVRIAAELVAAGCPAALALPAGAMSPQFTAVLYDALGNSYIDDALRQAKDALAAQSEPPRSVLFVCAVDKILEGNLSSKEESTQRGSLTPKRVAAGAGIEAVADATSGIQGYRAMVDKSPQPPGGLQ
jgi:hypothetical protein